MDNPTKLNPALAKLLITGKKDLYVVYFDESDSSIHLDIKAIAINNLSNANPMVIPLLIKTLATATQMLSEDYLLMLQAGSNKKKGAGITITDAIPESNNKKDSKSN